MISINAETFWHGIVGLECIEAGTHVGRGSWYAEFGQIVDGRGIVAFRMELSSLGGRSYFGNCRTLQERKGV